VLIKLTPKVRVTDLTFPAEIITEAGGATADVVIRQNTVNLILDVNKQAIKRH
jgi:dihydroorotate dehydrogenase